MNLTKHQAPSASESQTSENSRSPVSPCFTWECVFELYRLFEVKKKRSLEVIVVLLQCEINNRTNFFLFKKLKTVTI